MMFQLQLQVHQEAITMITMITMVTITMMLQPLHLQLPQVHPQPLQLQLAEAFACNLAVPLSSEACFSHMWDFYHEHF
jgi:hypothetical protein